MLQKLQMTLLEFNTIWYMDSSVRWLKPEMDKYYEMIQCRERDKMYFTINARSTLNLF